MSSGATTVDCVPGEMCSDTAMIDSFPDEIISSDIVTLNDFPDEILEKILALLPVCDMARAACVCSRWSELLQDTKMWKGKKYEVEQPVKKEEILSVVKVWPTLISLNLVKGDRFKMSLNASGGYLELQNMKDKTVHSVVAPLMTKSVSVDVSLLDEGLENCLVVQTQNILRLSVNIPVGLEDEEMSQCTAAGLKALAYTVSSGALPALRSLRITCKNVKEIEYDSCAGGDLLCSLRACPDLRQLRLCGCTCVSWKMVTHTDELRVLSISHSKIRELLIPEQCQNLRDVSLENCPFLRKMQFWDMCHNLNLQVLHISNTRIDSALLENICRIAPGLEKLVLQSCSRITSTAFVRHCSHLQHFELTDWFPEDQNFYFDLALLPLGLKHLTLAETSVTEIHLRLILQRLPMLEILNLSDCLDISSVSFLEHCTELVDLNLSGLYGVPSSSFSVLAQLRKLRNLNLRNCSVYSSLLNDVLQRMPNLKKLDLSSIQTLSNMFFLNNCHGLRCLNMSRCPRISSDIAELRHLANTKTLRIYGVPGRPFITDLEREWN